MGLGESSSGCLFSSFFEICLGGVFGRVAFAHGLVLVVGGSEADPRFGSGSQTCLRDHIASYHVRQSDQGAPNPILPTSV